MIDEDRKVKNAAEFTVEPRILGRATLAAGIAYPKLPYSTGNFNA